MDTDKLATETSKLLNEYVSKVPLNDEQKDVVNEVVTRIKTENVNCKKLIEKNNKILSIDSLPSPSGDDIMQTLINASKNDKVLANFLINANGQLNLVQTTKFSGYDMVDLEEEAEEIQQEVKALLRDTESFYENLWKIEDRIRKLPGLKGFDSRGVRGVRNDLIQHTDKSGASIFSFGVATNGPVLRPTRPVNSKAVNDKGVKNNTEQFFTRLNQYLRRAIEEAT